MKFAFKLALTIFLTGTLFLVLFSIAAYQYNRYSVIESQLDYTQAISYEISQGVEQLLIEKAKTALTLAHTPLIKNALDESNIFYAKLSEESRKASIKDLDSHWKGIKDEKDPYILKYTDNQVACYFKEQQSIIKDEYGEIFLTNKFGALVASTSKLSTFAHGHKSWWLGSYDNGNGLVFFDDRGYDDSVAGYVLGVVVPVGKGGGIAGILKCNLNILGAINRLISNAQDNLIGDLRLVRSGGAVVFEEGSEPLSTKIPGSVLEKLKGKPNGSFVVDIAGEEWLVGFSEIELTSVRKGYGFGGTSESLDHKKGNTGESWYILDFREMESVLLPVVASIRAFVLTIIFVVLILAIAALFLGRRAARPLISLTEKIGKVAKGDFGARSGISSKDEFGILARSFNRMAEELGHTTTSIKSLEEEIILRKKSETEKEHLISELKEALKQVDTLQGLVPICANCKNIRDDKGYWQKVEKYVADRSQAVFSHSICPECAEKLYPKLDLYGEDE